MAEVRYSPEALRDLEKIEVHISESLSSPLAAQRTINDILDAVKRLEDFPDMGAPLSNLAYVKTDHRFVVAGHYVAIYRHVAFVVYVVRILYAKQNYMRVLFDDEEMN